MISPIMVGQKLAELEEQIKRLEQEKQLLELEKQSLADQLEALKRRFFGRSSEQVEDATQQQLFDESEQLAEPSEGDAQRPVSVKSHTRTPHRESRKPLSESLPREDIHLELSEEERVCGCGAELLRIGEEVSEKLDVLPARFVVKRYIRGKYACRNCEGSGDEELPAVRITPMPPAIIPRGIATPGLLAFILTAKYVDGLPFARQEKSFSRYGVKLSRQRMADWAMAVAEVLKPVIEQLLIELRAGPVLLIDETPVQVHREEGKENTSRSYMWVGYGGAPESPVVYYHYAATRACSAADTIVGNFRGYLQSDGYEAYERVCAGRVDLHHAGCWAHARRKFFDARSGGGKSGAAENALSTIAKLYSAESKLAEWPRDEQFLTARYELVESELVSFHKWLIKKAEHVPPKSSLGKAVGYTLGQWEKLVRYLESPYLSPDTNRVENKIRPFVIGRKAWLFSGSPRGAQAMAGLYSLIETAKANSLEPYRYLRAVIERLPTSTDYRSLLPNYIDFE